MGLDTRIGATYCLIEDALPAATPAPLAATMDSREARQAAALVIDAEALQYRPRRVE